jgi:hypothetical protein
LAHSPRNGRPQSSNVIDAVGDDDTVRVSITADRVKYKNLVRDPRVSSHLNRDDYPTVMLRDQRCALGLRPTRALGMLAG